jgi:phenylacetic acid degradation operon negative regulatory protein
VIASTLLGTHPPRLPSRLLVRSGELFGIAEGAIRTAISRMLAAGELEVAGANYQLAGDLLGRQARQDASRHSVPGPWDGQWELAVVPGGRRAAAARTSLREAMRRLKLAELREGVWLRPDNLDRGRSPDDRDVVASQCDVFRSVPDGPGADLAASLWDLAGWSDAAVELIAGLEVVQRRLDDGERAVLRDGFVLSAAVLRHLLADPLLPDALLPQGWPGAELRDRYEEFDRAFQAVWRTWFTAPSRS